tara:strand:+ start:994 stop:1239 length:246 start_codon:yes stop_codon:yes gene_type:complete
MKIISYILIVLCVLLNNVDDRYIIYNNDGIQTRMSVKTYKKTLNSRSEACYYADNVLKCGYLTSDKFYYVENKLLKIIDLW